jgi:anti-sigma regulatory factor (Ser/Thr protein kinase)
VATISIPRINDGPRDFDTLFSIWSRCQDLHHIDLDFSDCVFLKQNAVAFLGGMIASIKSEGRSVYLKSDTLSSALRTNLEQNGFLYEMGLDVAPWDGNSVPYRQDIKPDMETISWYLKEKWIGRGWLNIHPDLIDAIVGNVLEIYSNAFTHGYSSIGVHSCGQRYPQLKELKITAVDFGIGIPKSVRDYLQSIGKPYSISDDKTLQLAFQEGFSTRPGLGGLGLKLLKEFIQINNGRLDIYSHRGHAVIDSDGERYEIMNSFFKGTVVNISINIDQKFYYLSTESSNQTPFR